MTGILDDESQILCSCELDGFGNLTSGFDSDGIYRNIAL